MEGAGPHRVSRVDRVWVPPTLSAPCTGGWTGARTAGSRPPRLALGARIYAAAESAAEAIVTDPPLPRAPRSIGRRLPTLVLDRSGHPLRTASEERPAA